MLGTRSRKIVAVAHVGSGSAGVAIVALESGTPAKVLAAARSVLPFEERSRKAIIARLGEHMSLAAEKAEKIYANASGPAHAVYCVVGAPWARSHMSETKTAFHEERRITQHMIAERAREALADHKEFESADLLEASVVRVELNGYPTAEPEGKSAHSIALSTLVSDCPADLRKSISSNLGRSFPHIEPVFRSGTRALLSVLRNLGDDEDRTIVDMSQEETVLLALRGGALAGQHMTPEGVRGILKRLAPNGIPEDTLSLVRLIGRDQCTSTACDEMRTAMGRIEPELVRVFGEGMMACASQGRVPGNLVLATHPDMGDWLAKFFARLDFAQFTQTAQPFAVRVFSPKDIARSVGLAEGVEIDHALAFAAALINTELNGG